MSSAGKDDRLYARIALDFADHPKIYTLSDAAFRAIIEMTLYSRRHLSDGKIKVRFADKRWGTDVLTELCSNDEERPSVYVDGPDYILHDFAKHQETRAEVEQKKQRNSENGRRGGLARAANQARKQADPEPSPSDSVATGQARASESLSEPPSDSLSEGSSPSQAETETETKTTLPSEGGAGEPAPTTRRKTSKAEPLGQFSLNRTLREWAAAELTALANVSEERQKQLVDAETRQFVDYWRSESGPRARKKDWVAAWRVWMRRSNLNPGAPSGARARLAPVEPIGPRRQRITADTPYED